MQGGGNRKEPGGVSTEHGVHSGTGEGQEAERACEPQPGFVLKRTRTSHPRVSEFKQGSVAAVGEEVAKEERGAVRSVW